MGEHPTFFAKVGPKLVELKKSLTDAGKTAIQAAFKDGSGPTFEGKDALIDFTKPAPPKEEKKESKDKDKEKDRDRDKEKEKDKDKDKDDRDRRDDRDRDRRDRRD